MDISVSLLTEFKGKNMDNVVFYCVGTVFSLVSLLEEICFSVQNPFWTLPRITPKYFF